MYATQGFEYSLMCESVLCVIFYSTFSDFNTQRVSFLPVEESEEGTASLRKNNIYQIHLLAEKGDEW
jgi:hypothetical protein